MRKFLSMAFLATTGLLAYAGILTPANVESAVKSIRSQFKDQEAPPQSDQSYDPIEDQIKNLEGLKGMAVQASQESEEAEAWLSRVESKLPSEDLEPHQLVEAAAAGLNASKTSKELKKLQQDLQSGVKEVRDELTIQAGKRLQKLNEYEN